MNFDCSGRTPAFIRPTKSPELVFAYNVPPKNKKQKISHLIK